MKDFVANDLRKLNQSKANLSYRKFVFWFNQYFRVLHQAECLGLDFDYDGGPIVENGGPIFW